ncbi:DUF6455 family protein [Rhodobacter sp. KR11]|uniref:DUF6455 family protein n=1 Tax=Rhodobacter sp. KR11 TaxID=2974588 RepID=UPI0022232123|nr:DUF6455 family protein [Rhodobacter sp. KR11]MCW1920009.1 DUF6455 family protein [Rhodobacter sp. KR11]
MMGYVEAPRAWGLTRGMARAVGLDLVSAVTEGWLSRTELGCLVETCEACDQSARCTAWLAVTLRTEALPPYCRNAAALGALQP